MTTLNLKTFTLHWFNWKKSLGLRFVCRKKQFCFGRNIERHLPEKGSKT